MSIENPQANIHEESKKDSDIQKEEPLPKRFEFYQDVEDHARKIVEAIHKYSPKYIFLTETTSIQVGLLIKKALKAAYPDEPKTIFYRIDPKQVLPILKYGQDVVSGIIDKDESYEIKKKELEDFFKKRIDNHDARILIYDADWAVGGSPGSIVSLLKNPENFGFSSDIKCQDVKMNLSERDDNKLNLKSGNQYRYHRTDKADGREESVKLDIKKSDIVKISGYGGFPYPDMKLTNKEGRGGKNFNFRGKIRKKIYEHLQQGWLSQQNLIREINKQGAELGKLIRKEDKKKKDKK